MAEIKSESNKKYVLRRMLNRVSLLRLTGEIVECDWCGDLSLPCDLDEGRHPECYELAGEARRCAENDHS